MNQEQPSASGSRRALLAAALAAAIAPPLAAQPRPAPRRLRLGYLGGSTADPITLRSQIEPQRQGLRDLGYVEGRNLTLEIRFAEARYERLPALLDELLRLDLDVLVTAGPRPAMLARDAVKKLPVVAVAVDDPVQMGLVASHTRPGGNITGISAAFEGLVQKRMQLLKDILPAARRFAILFNPDTVPPQGLASNVPRWQQALGLAVQLQPIRGPDDFDAAFAALAAERADGVLLFADAVIWTHRARLGALCQQYRLPSVWGGGGYLDAGGLLAYQGDWPALFRRGAALVDKIARGTPPGEIPFEQGTKLELVVNLKAARALGLTIPQSVLVAADEVLQ